MMNWDDFIGPDEEPTSDTLAAWVAVDQAVRKTGVRVEAARQAAEMRVRVYDPERDYVIVVRGQSSVTGRGKTGAHPERIAALRELNRILPVLFLSVETGAHTAYATWLDRNGESGRFTASIARDPAHKRAGWRCQDMTRLTLDGESTPSEQRTLRFALPSGEAVPDLDEPGDVGRMFA
jgi:hypothetical protein